MIALRFLRAGIGIVVLTLEFRELRPDPRRFFLVYRNPTFRVFRRVDS